MYPQWQQADPLSPHRGTFPQTLSATLYPDRTHSLLFPDALHKAPPAPLQCSEQRPLLLILSFSTPGLPACSALEFLQPLPRNISEERPAEWQEYKGCFLHGTRS